MCKPALFVVSVVLAAPSVFAQDTQPKYELFAGYSYRGTRIRLPSYPTFCFSPSPRLSDWESAHGWAMNLTRNLHRNVGVTADLAGQYGPRLGPIELWWPQDVFCAPVELHNFSSYQFLFGPRFSFREGRVTEYAHTLFGVSRLFGGMPQTNFAMGFGGGVDISLNKRFSIRAVQADYIPEKGSHVWRHHVRLQTGIVLKFGRR